ncbi:MAG: radical SAM protein [Magnetococcus sp. WYHC-3]
MRVLDYLTRVLPKALPYALFRAGYWPGPLPGPLTLTFSVTAACQSRCRTCHIGARFADQPALVQENLDLPTIRRAFASLGPVYFFNISGGEPFMRDDLDQIVRLACIHLRPRLIHIPTNAIGPARIERITRRILAEMARHAPAGAVLTIKPSVDGVGERHDDIRGYPGNFADLEETLRRLRLVQADDPRLTVDLGTVVSVWNRDHLAEVEAWVHAQGIQSYRHEIAEERYEFANRGEAIAPAVDVYLGLLREFQRGIVAHIGHKALLTRVTEAVRLVYYDAAWRILTERRQVTPCLGGISNIHLNYDGTVWTCCVLGGDNAMGHLRDHDGDLRALLQGDSARRARAFVAGGGCACPLANQWLNNILLSPRWMWRVVGRLVPLLLARRDGTTSAAPGSAGR